MQANNDSNDSMEFLNLFSDYVPKKISKTEHLSRKRKAEDALNNILEDSNSIKRVKVDDVDKLLSQNPLNNLEFINLNITDCLHEVVYSKDVPYQPLNPRLETPVLEFPFELDPFQKQAIQCIENNQNVLVAAHTSAGKTVTADYTIALCMKKNSRVIYTTPIKALSNQKYRDFKEQFNDVGLMTGDVTYNEDATVLVMTTEILRLMLYKNSSIVKEVAWIIYDEIHYMRDSSRGYVWEECIILSPTRLRMLFLSATIPNARQFAQWITNIHKQPCNIVYTEYRPTPLEHSLFPNTGDTVYKVVNKQGEFLEHTFMEAIIALRMSEASTKSDIKKLNKNKTDKNVNNNCLTLIEQMVKKDLLPIIVFSFSKKKCEQYAKSLTGLYLNTRKFQCFINAIIINNHQPDKKKTVEYIFNKAIESLPEEDRNLPSFAPMLELLKRGIGVHHSGLLPVVKEIVEILFGEGLLSVLFATETFAMGLNMPARTVIFTSVTKFDGANQRLLTPGEYIQMSGRAGRRNRDKNGNVIIMLEPGVKHEEIRNLLRGAAEPLNSSYHLTYNMILNLLKVDTYSPEYLMERSFLQFQAYSALPDLMKKRDEYTVELEKMKISSANCNNVKSLQQLEGTIKQMREKVWRYNQTPEVLGPFIVPGRVIHIKYNDIDFGLCIAMSELKHGKFKPNYIECVIPVASGCSGFSELSMVVPAEEPIPSVTTPAKHAVLLQVELCHVFGVFKASFKCGADVDEIRKSESMMCDLLNCRVKTYKRLGGLFPLVKVSKKHKSRRMIEAEKKLDKKYESLAKHKLEILRKQDCEAVNKLIAEYAAIGPLRDKIKQLTEDIDRRVSMIKMEELASRRRILEKLKYLSCQRGGKSLLEMKGRVASEISSGCNGSELVLTELLMNGDWQNWKPESLVAAMSVFVYDKSCLSDPSLFIPADEAAVLLVRRVAADVARVAKECQLNCLPEADPTIYPDNFGTDLVSICGLWAEKKKFNYIACGPNQPIADGCIVRTIRRLEELISQLSNAAAVIGNDNMVKVANEASKLIKRGIIFAASLYFNDE